MIVFVSSLLIVLEFSAFKSDPNFVAWVPRVVQVGMAEPSEFAILSNFLARPKVLHNISLRVIISMAVQALITFGLALIAVDEKAPFLGLWYAACSSLFHLKIKFWKI